MNMRERLILITAVVLLGGIVFKFLIYDPQQAAYASLLQSRDAAAAELARQESVLAKADSVQKEYARVTEFIRAAEAKLPRSKEIPALLTAMEQLTKRLGIGFESIHPGQLQAVAAPGTTATPELGQGAARPAGKEPAGFSYSKMEVALVLTGTFPQIVEYLRDLRDFPRLILVDSIAMSPQNRPKLDATLVTEIFVQGAGTPPTEGGK